VGITFVGLLNRRGILKCLASTEKLLGIANRLDIHAAI